MGDPMYCNARNRGHADLEPAEPGSHAGEGYCKRKAGWGTDHLGQGRCKFHGGSSPVRHGRYARYLSTDLGDEIDRLMEDPDPLDMEEELATARVLLGRALDNDDLSEPQRMGLVGEVSKIVKRIEDVRAANAVSLPELTRLMTEMGRVVAYHVDDQETIDAIRQEWRSIRL